MDRYPAYPTPLGIAWGLDGWWIGDTRVEAGEQIEPLALDEQGRASAWVRSFGGPPGTGFVYLFGASGMSDPGSYRRILAVAEAGIGRAIGDLTLR